MAARPRQQPIAPDSDLVRAHIETLYVLDGQGDLRTTNEPFVPARRPAPAFHLGWAGQSWSSCFRHDVPDEVRRAVAKLVARQWPFPSPAGPADAGAFVRMLPGTDHWSCGPAFVVPQGTYAADGAVPVTRADADILEPGFPSWIEEVEDTQPFFAVAVDGQAASICQTVRRSGHWIRRTRTAGPVGTAAAPCPGRPDHPTTRCGIPPP